MLRWGRCPTNRHHSHLPQGWVAWRIFIRSFPDGNERHDGSICAAVGLFILCPKKSRASRGVFRARAAKQANQTFSHKMVYSPYCAQLLIITMLNFCFIMTNENRWFVIRRSFSYKFYYFIQYFGIQYRQMGSKRDFLDGRILGRPWRNFSLLSKAGFVPIWRPPRKTFRIPWTSFGRRSLENLRARK